MNKLTKIVFALLIPFLLLINPVSTSAEEPYTIDEYYTDIIVNEDGTIDITEEVDVTFNQLRRGIFFQIASHYEMYLDEQQREYTFPISNIKVKSNHSYDIETESNGVTIRLGNEDYYANNNEKYIISYRLHTKDLELETYSMLFYNIIYQWDTTIDHTSFNIQMPKDFSTDDLYFDIGFDTDNLNYLDYTINNNIISGSYNKQLAPYESITILLKLPETYFTYPTYDLYYWIICAASLIILVVSYFIFLKVGKDDPLIITAEFVAPENTSSAECGYIIDGQIDNRDIMSLIIEWAKDGYIRITDNDQADLTFIKLKELPTKYPKYQLGLFSDLFKSGDEIKTSDLKEKFHKNIEKAKGKLNTFMHLDENKIYSGESIGMRAIVCVLGIIPITLFSIVTIWLNTYSVSHVVFTGVAHIASLTVIYLLFFKDEQLNKTYSKLVSLMTYVLSFVVFILISWFTIGTHISYVQWIILVLYTIIMAFVSQKMIKRTVKGHRLYGQVVGLYQFIQYAEKDRLKVLAKDNPYIFYHVLPYAFAFNLTDLWSEHFKDLSIPEVDWYYYNGLPLTNYYLMRSFSRSMMYAQTELVSLPPIESRGNDSSGGFGGFGGGGLGGGGFSGGGFGGSSGGSW